ncbi:methionyl-tRNA formyltransferase (plasmid) [Legionella adelaidensis]|uniref:Methionyl-tRNA formyltransferase n=1 Tax=Legionella adelaidensis TaxID=45056 RepID=A0A0W0R5W5_9GAMM|nr:methionyl-tRNA formyltransferase [Legionella adelaidensis]KTC66414.1 methionyl-tRNA formyltransferase [Legionella adelaidensis]VEH85012.1 methionyl-tRNA formyltransferase [Legionella adelaidensis]
MNPLRIVFAGTPEFGIPSLDALGNSAHQIVAIYTQPDRPAGRGRKLQASAIKEWGIAHQIPIYQPLHFKDPETIETLRALKPDVMVVIAYGLILPEKVLNLPTYGCVNVHASLLPRWRGASPIQHAILFGDNESGVSIMEMDKGMDTGPVYLKVTCPINKNDTSVDLHDRLAKLAIEPLLFTLNNLAEGKKTATPQNHESATYAPKIKKEDALIQWDKPATEINQVIRAFNPWPIAYTFYRDQLVKIYEAEVVHRLADSQPGTVLQLDKNGILVATTQDCILIKRIQFPNGKILPIQDWLNANKNTLKKGDIMGESLTISSPLAPL